ncbi:uncharacterized protein LOC143551002 [Bidens hawaiensis]|uniref:uncharacterized protein LOC143550964 n=1 Tax=Bidens hawaiensis TaxID=980011 RepID=UPI00404A1088
MSLCSQLLVFLLAITLWATSDQTSEAHIYTPEHTLKSKVYKSPKITQYPGSVSNKYYYNIEFPKGHIAIKSFDAEIVDETDNPVSLQETYLHHWVALNYYIRKGDNPGLNKSDFILAGNSGICNDHLVPQVWGLGAETRKTSTYIPDPYAIEVGNPLQVPDGYLEQWMFNIHAIDTRNAVDVLGCAECRCDLFNVTEDEYHRLMDLNYGGGKYCCYDGAQCKVKNKLKILKRDVYMKYTIEWVDWSDSIIPVKVYMFDITDTWQYTGIHNCTIEYDIKKPTTEVATSDFTSTKRSMVTFPVAGDVIYGVGHQHIGGIGTALYGENGNIICMSKPIYGQGNSVGDEAGYIVGMSTCYPEPGSVKIAKGEALTLEVNYSSEKNHTGVMGLFYILVAESSLELNDPVQNHQESKVSKCLWGIVVLAPFAVVLIAYRQRKQDGDGYQPIVPLNM